MPQLTRRQAIEIFEGLGIAGSERWSRDKMQKRLESLHELVSEDQTIGDAKLDNLLDDLIYAGRNRPEEIQLAMKNGSEAEPPKAKAPKPIGDKPEGELGDKPGTNGDKPAKANRHPNSKGLPSALEEIGKRIAAEPPAVQKVTKVYNKRQPARPPYLVRPNQIGRYHRAAELFRQYGLDEGITPEIINLMDDGVEKPNATQDLTALKNTWQALRGYLYGKVDWDQRVRIADTVNR